MRANQLKGFRGDLLSRVKGAYGMLQGWLQASSLLTPPTEKSPKTLFAPREMPEAGPEPSTKSGARHVANS